MDKLYLFLSIFVAVLSTAFGLECYTCEEQKRNSRSDCTSKTRQCEQFQDACTSYIRWGIPSKWTPRGDRRYYISKDCDTFQGCNKRMAATYTTCQRDWYNDWACVECCTGDLCNYFVTLGAGSVRSGTWTLLVTSVTALGLRLLLR